MLTTYDGYCIIRCYCELRAIHVAGLDNSITKTAKRYSITRRMLREWLSNRNRLLEASRNRFRVSCSTSRSKCPALEKKGRYQRRQ